MPSQARPNERQAIENLQRYLRQLSYDEPRIPIIPIDGIFAGDTKNALIQYQLLKNLAPTGQADYITWNQLYADYLESMIRNSAPKSIEAFPRFPNESEVTLGLEGFLVEFIQFALEELRAIYPDIPQIDQSGVFDKSTEEGIKVFQAHHGLIPSGRVDKKTWNALVAAFNRWDGQ